MMQKIFCPPHGEKQHHNYQTTLEKNLEPGLSSFAYFINNQITASIFLFVSLIAALFWASSPNYHEYYLNLQQQSFGFSWGKLTSDTTIKTFVNDFLMTLFFFLLGLEIKKEYLAGELSNPKIQKTVFILAFAGVITPVMMFLMLISKGTELSGWGIPIATDTAFALGILALFKNKVPKSLFSFVAALAVIDDICAIVILAIFYSSSIHLQYLALSCSLMLLLIILNLFGVRGYFTYLIIGLAVWFCIEYSGLHGTLAGVMVAFTIPARPKTGPQKFVNEVDDLTTMLDQQENANESTILEDEKKQEIVEKIEELAQDSAVPLSRLQHKIEPYVILLILPLFALVNAGVSVTWSNLSLAMHSSLSVGIMISLCFGKFAGITFAIYLVRYFKWGALPEGTQVGHFIGVAFLAGMGFTMSLFITELAFTESGLINKAKTGILIGSMLSGLLGMIYFQIYTTYNQLRNQC